jgi:hypothetical protein
MKPLNEYGNEVWDRFFDFIADDAVELSRDEVKAELREAGIDMAPAYERLRKLLDKHRLPPTEPPCPT